MNSVVTALGLAVLILVFTPAGGAHFNPVVTAADWLLGRRTPHRYGLAEAAAVMACQVAGAISGAALADAMFAEPVLTASRNITAAARPILLSEVVATAGLLLVIVTLARTGRTQHAAWSVGAWIGAAYWFTASTSFANPAVTIGRTLTNTYAGIAPASAPAFITAQLVGGVARHAPGRRCLSGHGPPGRTPTSPPAWLADRKGTPMADIPEVLFVCTHNAGRSQMAAALLGRHAAGRLRVTSAGSQPASQLNPAVVQAMAEIGLDLSRRVPQAAHRRQGQGRRGRDHHGLRGRLPGLSRQALPRLGPSRPGGTRLEQVRPIRDDIGHRVEQLLAELVATHG